MKLWMHLFLSFALFVTSVAFLPQPAQASLLITPLHVVIEGRQRSGEIIVVNTSDETKRYRFGWSQVEQSEALQGGYVDTVLDENKAYLKDFAVFSPRQITLKPGEKQTVRIAVRRPADLIDAEYKSHMQLSAISIEDDRARPTSGIRARVNFSYSIPVVYRIGEHDVQIAFDDPSFKTNAQGNIVIQAPVRRSGPHGVIGHIEVFHKPTGEKEVLIGNVGGASIFPEINKRTFDINLLIKGLEPGKLRFVFWKNEGKRKDRVLLAEKIVNTRN